MAMRQRTPHIDFKLDHRGTLNASVWYKGKENFVISVGSPGAGYYDPFIATEFHAGKTYPEAVDRLVKYIRENANTDLRFRSEVKDFRRNYGNCADKDWYKAELQRAKKSDAVARGIIQKVNA